MGHKLEVLSNPEQNALPYIPQFSKTEEDILTSEVNDLVEKGAIEFVTTNKQQFVGFYISKTQKRMGLFGQSSI